VNGKENQKEARRKEGKMAESRREKTRGRRGMDLGMISRTTASESSVVRVPSLCRQANQQMKFSSCPDVVESKERRRKRTRDR
jgi:hypothetical protein